MADKVEKRILTLYSDVQATSVHWLWYPFIAVGKITLLQGDPGDGKSTMMMNLIAELSKGGTTPDGKPVGMPQRIIYDIVGTFGVPVEEHRKESEVKQMDGYVSMGILTGKIAPEAGKD